MIDLFFLTYRLVSFSLSPLLRGWALFRLYKKKEHPIFVKERFGKCRHTRPDGDLIWIHGASVGESLSSLPLIYAIQKMNPKVTILLTTGTKTSQDLMGKRLPKTVLLQTIPFDTPQAVDHFYAHYRPTVGFILESEVWPNLLTRATFPLFLLNARLSDRSFKRWQAFKAIAQKLLGSFTSIYAQSQNDTDKFTALGIKNVSKMTNLKFYSKPLPYDAVQVEQLKKELNNRFVWVAASTHEHEEEMILRVHKKLLEKYPTCCLILIPRHPNRALEIEDTFLKGHFNYTLYSNSYLPSFESQVHLVDCLGVIGQFYALKKTVFLGGSLVPVGGHNIIEPIQFGCSVYFGPYMQNCLEIANSLKDDLSFVKDENDLLTRVIHDFEQPALAISRGQASLSKLDCYTQNLEFILKEILKPSV